MSDGTRPVIIRIKNPTPKGKGWWYWTGNPRSWSVKKEDGVVFECDYDASVVIYRNQLKSAVVINA